MSFRIYPPTMPQKPTISTYSPMWIYAGTDKHAYSGSFTINSSTGYKTVHVMDAQYSKVSQYLMILVIMLL